MELESGKARVRLFAKQEGNNPGGSVKDRAAYNMLQGAIDAGELLAGDTIVEATSGNTGIALAMVGQLLGIRVVLVMPESATEERKQVMRAYGAELILTPADLTIEYARKHADELVAQHDYKMLNQFGNDRNWQAHFKGTGPEIWKQTNGSITHFVSAMGTTGTIMGTGRYLKTQNDAVQIIGAQPEEGSRIPGIRKWSVEMQPEIYKRDDVDALQYVSRDTAVEGSKELALNHGILAGMSSGGAYQIAKQVVEEITEGVVVFIVCDRGDRYLSSKLFE